MRFALLTSLVLLPIVALSDIHVTNLFLAENREMPFVDWRGNAVEHYVLGEFDLAGTRLP